MYGRRDCLGKELLEILVQKKEEKIKMSNINWYKTNKELQQMKKKSHVNIGRAVLKLFNILIFLTY